MKRLLLCLLPLALAACNPFPKDEDSPATPIPAPKDAKSKPAGIVTPTPTPKPGAWMNRKSAVPLETTNAPMKNANPLDPSKSAKERDANPLERKAFKN